ncbi:hypothetical protein fBA2_008 [Acinetobacter virus fBenAci002]|uniref:Uncharacterized protein n=1 Tax=Acinetobacter virus fBenAci002 TaxID=2781369 RepID=A0A7S6RB75_9CAUD|nr:hypothetical protein fBA2_008 [Acinetobacter virus fBenAci002]
MFKEVVNIELWAFMSFAAYVARLGGLEVTFIQDEIHVVR